MPHLWSLLIQYLSLPNLFSYRQLRVASSSSNMNISQDNNCSKSNLGEFTWQSLLFTFVTIQFLLFNSVQFLVSRSTFFVFFVVFFVFSFFHSLVLFFSVLRDLAAVEKFCLIKVFAYPRLRPWPLHNPYLLLRPWNDVGFSWLLRVRDHV